VKSVVKNKAFTIVELLVAMGLLVMLLTLSGLVFSTTVEAHRKAGASIDISRNLRAVTDQLNTDFRGLRKDGEILLAWIVRPAIDEKGNMIDVNTDGIPDYYQKFDRILFFADGDFQTYKTQPTLSGPEKIVHGNLARLSYMLAKDGAGTKASDQPDRARRILARTEHIVTADADLPDFPDWTVPWDPAVFEVDNFINYEYQTTTMGEWTNMSQSTHPYFAAKNNILTILSDISNILAADAIITNGGPRVEIGQPNTYPNLFCSGVGEFGIQIWLDDEKRWYPQIDPDGNGIYTDTDYLLKGAVIDDTLVGGVIYPNPATGAYDLITNANMSIPAPPLKFTALKFTFTLYDSKGIISGGKTFTHIVYLDN
jgi:type II secretory pathway pseudopilin PulG